MEAKKKINIQIKMRDELEPVYTNFANINHKEDEFIFTFCHVFPVPGPKPLARGNAKAIVTMTPKHAKQMLNILSRTIQKYEQKFGEIKSIKNENKSGMYA